MFEGLGAIRRERSLVPLYHVVSCVCAIGAFGCRGVIGDPGYVSEDAADDGAPASASDGPRGPRATGAAGASGTTGASPGRMPPGSAGTGSMAGSPATDGGKTGTPLLPARLRRITNAEFDSSVRALLGIESTFGASFTPDSRQGGFTRNDAQRVDPVFIAQLSDAAERLSAMAKSKAGELARCAEPSGSATCAREFVKTFSERAYRRPSTSREVDALMAVYEAGSEGATYGDGIAAVVSAVLQSPGFVYVTEIGPGTPSQTARLSEFEIASTLAFLVTGAPPDDALRKAAIAGELSAPDARRSHARRLLSTPAATAQVVRMVQEWLGIDRINETAKDSNVYPDFAGLRAAMKREADDFVTAVMKPSGGGVRELFAADWTIAEDNLARMYLNGQQPQRADGRVSLAGVRRRGILNQAAFLSVYAHATETAPVLRGVALLRRVACVNLPSPTSLNLDVVPPVPDPTKTTRERFAVHSKDPGCASCHASIDAIGFTFEALDAMGRQRSTENGRPIDSRTRLGSGYSFDGDFADSTDLALGLAGSEEVATCFAKQLFRFAAARSDAAAEMSEAAFVELVAGLPADAQGDYAALIEAHVASDAFVQRGANP